MRFPVGTLVNDGEFSFEANKIGKVKQSETRRWKRSISANDGIWTFVRDRRRTRKSISLFKLWIKN